MSYITINNLKVFYPISNGFFKREKKYLKAVNDISFELEKGCTYGLVGESGCGKSSLGKSLTGLAPIHDGAITINGEDLGLLLKHNRKKAAGMIQMIFQDPYGSLNPKLRIGESIAEGLLIKYKNISKEDMEKRVCEYLKKVGLHSDDYFKYPFEFSGGQRQRIGIARALAAEPEFIICDEMVSALDASIQASILNLLKDLQEEYNLTYLFISHDLSVVKFIANNIGIMYLGEMVEAGDCNKIFANPAHPYTKSLIDSAPNPDPDNKKEYTPLMGDVPSPINLPKGCFFYDRCPKRDNLCLNHPKLKNIDNRDIRCHHILQD